jgi:ribonuclease P protein component
MKHFGFPKTKRLLSAREFARVYERRQRAADQNLLIFADKNDREITRVGLSVSKKHGNAVARSRLKRLLREAFRLSQHDLPAGLDLILIPQQGAAATLDDLRTSLVRLVRKLARRLGIDDARDSAKDQHA